MSAPRIVLESGGVDALIRTLAEVGYRVVGPVLRDGALRYGEISGIADLPVGTTQVQEPGRARPAERNDDALFGYTVGPDSLKGVLFPPRRLVWRTRGIDGDLRFEPADREVEPVAVIGARPCDLAAMGIQDRVLTGGASSDPDYAARREVLFLVAVNCVEPGDLCFCASLGTGPAAEAGFDLALTEILDEERHLFVGEIGSEAGARMVARLPHREASPEELALTGRLLDAAAGRMGRSLEARRARELLVANPLAARWSEVASRCLACGNCTLVCPTCFCTTVEDTARIDGSQAERHRRWDSCFSLDFSFMGGRHVRSSVSARYRQWLTHKLATWVDQFGEPGCVGCGRCIAWCPVGIDLTEEVAALGREVEARA